MKDLVAGISVGLVTERSQPLLAAQLPARPAHEVHEWPQDYGRHAFITDIQVNVSQRCASRFSHRLLSFYMTFGSTRHINGGRLTALSTFLLQL